MIVMSDPMKLSDQLRYEAESYREEMKTLQNQYIRDQEEIRHLNVVVTKLNGQVGSLKTENVLLKNKLNSVRQIVK